MVKIRFALSGTKKAPNYRIVVMEARTPRQGRVIDTLGHYHPLTGPNAFVLDQEKLKKWLGQGAQPTEAVARLLAKAGVLEKPAAAQQPAEPQPATDTQ